MFLLNNDFKKHNYLITCTLDVDTCTRTEEILFLSIMLLHVHVHISTYMCTVHGGNSLSSKKLNLIPNTHTCNIITPCNFTINTNILLSEAK